jgi:dethiobiotin synthetase
LIVEFFRAVFLILFPVRTLQGVSKASKSMKNIFITGIGTDVGKTIVSAVICKALEADYWKPVQCGDLSDSDTMKVKRLIGKTGGTVHNEAFSFKHPLSPHAAAELEGMEIDPNEIYLPPANNNMIIEGAGGILVPLNDRHTMIDVIKEINAKVIVVSKHYLGSINHTLLTLFALHSYSIPVLGIIYVGDENPASERVIGEISQVNTIGRIEWAQVVNQEFIAEQAEKLRPSLRKFI